MRPRVWPVPITLALVTITGLVVALTGDGWRDAASWLALGVPIAAVARAVARSGMHSPKGTS